MRLIIVTLITMFSISTYAQLSPLEKNCSKIRDDAQKCCKQHSCSDGSATGNELQGTINSGINANTSVPDSSYGSSKNYGDVNAKMRDAYQTLGMVCRTRVQNCEATCRMAHENAKVASTKQIMQNLHNECTDDFAQDAATFDSLFSQYASAAAGGAGNAALSIKGN